MSQRFYVESPITGDAAVLAGAEAHHLLHVMRADVGHEVTLFDGSGAEFQARVAKTGRHQVDLDVLARHEIDRELPIEITLGVALPKGDRQRWLVEKATELGVAEVVPLTTARGVAQPADKALDRLRRAVVEACKQCGRNRLADIGPPQSVSGFCAAPSGGDFKWVAHPGGENLPEMGDSGATPRPRCFLAVGPEGGFDDEEIGRFEAGGWQIVSLGSRILRVETAALALVARIAIG